MKKLILILVLAFTAQVSFSQTKIDFFDFVRNFDWSISESDFQSKYKNYILPGTDSIPDFHATTGAWLLKDIYMGDYENRIVVDYNEQSNVSTIVLITDTIRDLDYAQIERVVGDELGEPTFADGDVELLVLGLQQTSAKLWIKKKQIFCSMALGEDDSKVFMLTIMKREPDFRKNYWGDSLEKVKERESKLDESGVEGIYSFTTRVATLECEAMYAFTNDKLTWGKYIFHHINVDNCVEKYNDLLDLLTQKYGEPARNDKESTAEDFEQRLFTEGELVRDGKMNFVSFWYTPTTWIALGLSSELYQIKLVIEYYSTLHQEEREADILEDL